MLQDARPSGGRAHFTHISLMMSPSSSALCPHLAAGVQTLGDSQGQVKARDSAQ